MKRYVLDQLFVACVGIVAVIVIPQLFELQVAIFLEVVVLLIYGYLCRRLILLPYDILHGKKNMTVYYGSQVCVENYEFFSKTHCVIWKFYFGCNEKIQLLVPDAVSKDGHIIKHPPDKNQRVKITYYKQSRIMCKWEPLDN